MVYLPGVFGVVVVRTHRLRPLVDDGTVGDVEFPAPEPVYEEARRNPPALPEPWG